MADIRTVHFANAAETWQLAIAKILKASAEKMGIQTKGPEEWVRVAKLATIDIDIDLGTRTFNVSPATKPLLENLVREYLIIGVKEVAQADASLLVDRTIIRVQDEHGKWSAISVRQATHRQFHDWATLWFHTRLGRYIDLGSLETTPEERESVVRLMVEQGIAPIYMEGGEPNG